MTQTQFIETAILIVAHFFGRILREQGQPIENASVEMKAISSQPTIGMAIWRGLLALPLNESLADVMQKFHQNFHTSYLDSAERRYPGIKRLINLLVDLTSMKNERGQPDLRAHSAAYSARRGFEDGGSRYSHTEMPWLQWGLCGSANALRDMPTEPEWLEVAGIVVKHIGREIMTVEHMKQDEARLVKQLAELAAA